MSESFEQQGERIISESIVVQDYLGHEVVVELAGGAKSDTVLVAQIVVLKGQLLVDNFCDQRKRE